MTTITPIQAYNLLHPLLNVPAVATVAGWYAESGRVVGLKLEFACGHTANLRYDEIRELTADCESAKENDK